MAKEMGNGQSAESKHPQTKGKWFNRVLGKRSTNEGYGMKKQEF